MSSDHIETYFKISAECLKEHQAVKEEVQQISDKIEKHVAEIFKELSLVFEPDGILRIPDICNNVREKFLNVHVYYLMFIEKTNKRPKRFFPKYYKRIRFVTQQLMFYAALMIFLESRQLLTLEEVYELIGVRKESIGKDFYIELNDLFIVYLHLIEDLARLTLICATNNHYSFPFQILEFAATLAGELEAVAEDVNETEKFNEMKSELEKIELIVHDLAIKGFTKDEG